MSTNPKIEVQGTSPFKQPSGVFEVQIAISDKKPSEQELISKKFSSLWKDNFHLKVENSKFKEILGSSENPLPKSVLDSTLVWVIVSDQFSSLNSVFEVQISKTSQKKPAKQEKPKVAPPKIEPELKAPPKSPKIQKEVAPPAGVRTLRRAPGRLRQSDEVPHPAQPELPAALPPPHR